MNAENECGSLYDDYRAEMAMIERAAQFGLLVEVVHAYGNERAPGREVWQATKNALFEWDI